MQTLIDIVTSPALVVLAGAVFVHASFQLGVSVLTLLSSHTIGRRLSGTRLLGLSFWYIGGVFAVTGLLLLGVMAAMRQLAANDTQLASTLTLVVLPLVSLLVVLFYYRRGRGTQLWLPRSAAKYITDRAKKTKSGTEAFALGATTAFAELPFSIAPLTLAAFIFQSLVSEYWFSLGLLYTVAVTLPLLFVSLYLSSGHKISSVQRWREQAKSFLRWTSAAALLLLAVYVAVLGRGVPS